MGLLVSLIYSMSLVLGYIAERLIYAGLNLKNMAFFIVINFGVSSMARNFGFLIWVSDACWHTEGLFCWNRPGLCHSIALEDLRTKPLNAWLLLTQVILCVSWQQMPADRKAFVCWYKGLGHSRWAFVFGAGVEVMHAWWLVRKAFSVVLWVINTS